MQTLRQKASLNKRSGVMPLSNTRSLDDSVTFARIWIDGYEIGGYLTYTALDAKSYFIEPVRSSTGVIENLNSYATFLTPQVTIEFKYMDIRTYRIIMKIIQQRNEHIVKYYDIVSDKMVTKKMYFKPEQLPTIFQRKLEILAVTDYKLELVGTNADLSTFSVIYHLNPPATMGIDDQTQGQEDIVSGEEIIIGEGITLKTNEQVVNAGNKFSGWNTSPDGTGDNYLDGYAYTINETNVNNGILALYAQWASDDVWTLSYNYGVGETYVDTGSNEALTSKEIQEGTPYGTLPTTQANPVTYNNQQYTPYTNPKWYKSPIATTYEDGTTNEVHSTDNYEVSGNSTIYQLFDTASYTITFVMNGATQPSNGYSPITAKYGASIYQPQTPIRDGYTFDGWWTTSDFQENTLFRFTTMPPLNITVYAKWIKNEE